MTTGNVDLETCDREPIHLIGAVQPHGALVAAAENSLVIQYASANLATFLGAPPEEALGKTLTALIGEGNVSQLLDIPLDPTTPELLRPWHITVEAPNGSSIKAECLPHRHGGFVILEFLQPELKPAPVWEDELLRRGIISELVKPGALTELAEASARIIRDVTGFDRVMIYKFAEDKHGEVIAESTDRPDKFLGLHYPASDIPDPARRHFTLNVMRSIPDINGEHVPILSQSGEIADASSSQPLDLTYSKLRAVAPVHVEYLNNMGVGASLSISLITNNELWGLVACHHYGTRLLSSSRLRFAELLGGTTSALLQSMENTLQLSKSIEAEKTAYQIEKMARSGASLRALVEEHASVLMDLAGAQGLLLTLAGDLMEVGSTPETSLDLTNLRTLVEDGVATTSHLSSVIDMDEAQKRLVGGAALLELSEDGKDSLVFLRSEFRQTIKWAGKPEKIETKTEDGITRLSPRGSFALWSEERRGKSRPFDALDRDAFRILRRALFALNSLEHERVALEAQKAAEAEEIRLRHSMLEAARASSMGELASAIAHELSQPLSAVANYVNACRQEIKNAGVEMPPQAEQLINEAVTETARAGDLVRRVRNFISSGDLNLDYINLEDAIKQGVELALVSHELPRLRVNFLFHDGVPKLLADPVQISQVVLNLVKNSITSMENSDLQVISIEMARVDEVVQVRIRDTGSGISKTQRKYLFEPFHTSTTNGMGIGLSLCRSIVDAHEGRIWAETASVGAEFVFELPIREENNEHSG